MTIHTTATGAIGMPVNRKGRKRKSGRREPSGRIRARPIDYRAVVAAQPHRNWLPEAVRGHEKAENVLGCLNLLRRISDEMYEAGRRFGVIVGAFRQVIGAPRGVVGAGRGFTCNPTLCLDDPACFCATKTARYRDAAQILTLAGQKPYNITYQVVVQDMMPSAEQLADLRCGLYALAQGFGLTRRGKS